MHKSRLVIVGLFFMGLLFVGSTMAQSYRMETHVYRAEDDMILGRNLTLFQKGLIVDFRLDPDMTTARILEITIYDRAKHKFILLDIDREIKLELDRSKLIQLLEAQRADLQMNDKTRYLADVKFVERENIDRNQIELDSEWVHYVVTGKHPADTSMLPIYHDFLDNFTMLASSDPGSLPPFARLAFNRALKKYGWLPERIELTLTPLDSILPKLHVYSTHQWGTKLASGDKKQLAMARKYWAQFRSVGLSEYRGLSAAEAMRQSATR